jgi:hypothetical protein
MRNVMALSILATLMLASSSVRAAAPTCEMTDDGVMVTTEAGSVEYRLSEQAGGCLVVDKKLYLAAGMAGIVVYAIDGPNVVRQGSWTPGDREVIRVERSGEGLVAVTARLEIVPLLVAGDGTVRQAGLASFLGGQVMVPTVAPTADPSELPPAEVAATLNPSVSGNVTEVRAEVAVLDVGSKDGVLVGDRFELRSQELKSQYSLSTGKDEMLPSNKVTAVVAVASVAEEKALVKLGRGDRARVGDVAVPTGRGLTGDSWFPGYERNLNRLRARVAPFLGIDTLSAGMVTSAMYDRTFNFPMRLEAGFSNIGFVFGEDFAAPFHFNVVPSYDTDYFEVGLGAGYVYSSDDRRRGASFLQKVRLGTVDGLNVTVHNSFVYQRGHLPRWFGSGYDSSPSLKIGADCSPNSDDEELTNYEFNWEGIDGTVSIPVTSRVTLISDWSFSNAGWFYGDIGIRTLVMGNGGHGTLIIPVTIGGVMIDNFVPSGDKTYCNSDSNTYATYQDYDTKSYGGPVVSIGIDYRWR